VSCHIPHTLLLCIFAFFPLHFFACSARAAQWHLLVWWNLILILLGLWFPLWFDASLWTFFCFPLFFFVIVRWKSVVVSWVSMLSALRLVSSHWMHLICFFALICHFPRGVHVLALVCLCFFCFVFCLVGCRKKTTKGKSVLAGAPKIKCIVCIPLCHCLCVIDTKQFGGAPHHATFHYCSK